MGKIGIINDNVLIIKILLEKMIYRFDLLLCYVNLFICIYLFKFFDLNSNIGFAGRVLLFIGCIF